MVGVADVNDAAVKSPRITKYSKFVSETSNLILVLKPRDVELSFPITLAHDISLHLDTFFSSLFPLCHNQKKTFWNRVQSRTCVLPLRT